MLTLTLLFTVISLILYVLLGGADFGAGIIEIFSGKRSINTISKAIAPVWEANHIWLIVVIVILFNAFPKVYSTVSLYLHIPILFILVGIIFRGTAFAFRYYDPFEDKSHQYFSIVFKLFSVFTPLFLGITLGAIILGKLTTTDSASFADKFIAPWFNFFSLSLGIFLVLLFAYLAAIYLTGETKNADEQKLFYKLFIRLNVLLVISGGLVFITAQLHGLSLLQEYFNSTGSIICLIIATLMIPGIILSLKNNKHLFSRVFSGIQVSAIILGWFAVQFPTIISVSNDTQLTIHNTAATEKTLLMLNLALIVGLLIIIPLLLFLFKTFKFDTQPAEESNL